MNGKDIFRGTKYLDPRFIEEAEFGEFSPKAFYKDTDATGRRSLRRPLLVAAAIAMALLLVGCGIVYVLKMQDLKLGDQQVTQERWDEESKSMISETVDQQVLTFAGLKGTPRYEAAKEWYEFKQTYDPDHTHYFENSNAEEPYEAPAEYSLYNIYTQQMQDKVDEIIAKYGLKLRGKQVNSVSSKALCDYLGIDGVLLPDAKAQNEGFIAYYDGGWFHADTQMTLTEEPDWPYRFLCSLYYSAADTFDTTICELNDTADWQEWNYTTQSGHTVLVLRSPSVWFSWVFYDRGDATITLRVETIREVYTDEHGYQEVIQTPMTDEVFKKVINTIDFDIQPVPGDTALLEGPAASKARVLTQNGYTVEVKEVFSDGFTTNIALGIIAPEDVNLEQYLNMESGGVYFHDISFSSPADQSHGGGMNYGFKADHDGKTNTLDYNISIINQVKDGAAFPKDSTWNLYLSNICAQVWNKELIQYDKIWEQEGTWNFQITMDNGDWTELEFIREPIVTNVCYGWDMDGNNVYRDETITSIKLHTFGANYTAPDALGALDFANYKENRFPKVVLKDGTEIKLDGSLALYDSDGRIPLKEVVHLELIDGTVLYPAEADPDRVTDYRLEVKSAVTDGKTAQVVLGLTVPYWAEMCQKNCGYSIGFGNFGDYTILMPMEKDMPSKEELMAKYAIGEELEAREDGDGRDDTVEIVYNMYVDAGQDPLVYFTPGSHWTFHVENMNAQRMHYPEGVLTEIEQLWDAAGIWNVDVTLEAGDIKRDS